MTEPKVLVTGANGFVGQAVCHALEVAGMDFIPAVRRARAGTGDVAVGDIDGKTDWSAALHGVDRVVHLAARVHVMHESLADPLSAYRTVNVDGTLHLARQAIAAGVRRFVFVSTVKVNGEGRSTPYSETDVPEPHDPYAASKWAAECGLRELAKASAMEIVILRPPLVYGPGVSANFERMMRTIVAGWPLPFDRMRNFRSMIFVGNLASVIALCLTHPQAANRTFLVSDGEDLSTPELLRRLGRALQRPARLIPVPAALLRAVFRLVGKAGVAQRLCASLRVDISSLREALGWSPPFSVDDGLQLTAQHFLNQPSRSSR